MCRRIKGDKPSIGICPRECFIEAKAKTIGSRYAVRVRVRANSWAQAEGVLQEYGIEAEPVADVVPISDNQSRRFMSPYRQIRPPTRQPRAR